MSWKEGNPGRPEKLIPNSQRTREQLQEMGRKGGKKAAETYRRRRMLKDAALAVLDMELLAGDDIREELEKRGLPIDGNQALIMAQMLRALAGDTEAARFVRDTSGQRPAQGIELSGIDGRPIESIDLSQMTDEQLRQIAEMHTEQGSDEE